MAEGILPADLAALLQSELSRVPVAPPGRPPGIATIAELLQAFDPNASTADLVRSAPQPIPTLGGGRRPPLDIAQLLQSNGATPPPPDTSVAQPLRTEPQPMTPGQEFMLEMTGLPSAQRASQHFQAARETGDPMAGIYGAGNLALAAPWATGPAIMRGVQAVRNSPTLAGFLAAGGAGGGLAAATEPTPVGAQRLPPPTDAIREEQRELARGGFYDGTIDGVDGPETQRARAAAAAARRETQRREQEQRERDEQRALEAAKTDADRERIRLEQERLKAEREAGQRATELANQAERMQAERQPGFMEQFGGYIAPLAGVVFGGLERGALGHALSRERRALGRRSDELARGMGGGDVPDRVARVNEFWREGAPRSPAPFAFQPGRQPYPWTSDPNAVAPSRLFSSSGGPIQNYGPMGLTAATAAFEGGLGYSWLGDATRRLEEAQRALAAPNGNTPVNVRRVQEAEEAVRQAEWMMRVAGGHLIGGAIVEGHSRMTGRGMRPSARAADAERGRLDMLLANPNAAARATPAASAPLEPGVTSFRNPSTGEVRRLDARGRWQGPRRGGGHGYTRPPDPAWERISQSEPTTMAEFLTG
jgi:hypothetical protein